MQSIGCQRHVSISTEETVEERERKEKKETWGGSRCVGDVMMNGNPSLSPSKIYVRKFFGNPNL